MSEAIRPELAEFAEILKRNEPLAPYTRLRLGGPAEYLAEPRNRDELSKLIRICTASGIPLRLLGNGCNVLVREEGVPGVVVRLSAPEFGSIVIDDNRVRAGAGASLAAVISHTAREGLSGLETLVGIPGTIGGAISHGTGDRLGELRQLLTEVEIVDAEGEFETRQAGEWEPSDRSGAFIVSVTLRLERDSTDDIVRRMRKAWISRKSKQPLSFQPSIKAFRNPRGRSAASLIEQAEMAGVRVGGAQVSERNPNYILIYPGATCRDVLRLLDLVRTRVAERSQVELQQEPTVW